MLVPLLLLELILRLLGPLLPGEYQTATFTTSAEVVGRRNQPNTAGWKRTAEFTTWVRVNSHGLRGPELSYARPPDTFRVLALGDSFTFALQVDEQETFVARLDELLDEAAGGSRVEVINAGVDGWSTVNQYAWLASEGYRYQPDLVLLMFYVGNDPGDNAAQVGAAATVEQLHLGVERPALELLRSALLRDSRAWNFLEHGLLAKLAPTPREDPELGRSLNPDEQQRAARELLGFEPERPLSSLNRQGKVRGWQVTESLLRRLDELCVAQGARLVVVEIPIAGQVAHRELTMTPLPTIAARAGLPVVELLPAFRAQPKRQRDRLYFQENRHWTPAGHAVATQTIATALVERGLLAAR